MSDASDSPMPMTADDLLTHSRWVHDLARSLVADPHLAEDLAQATCVVAIERPPVTNRNPRGWLAKVLHNLVRQHHRREGQRRTREARAARPEALPSVAEMAAEVQSQRMVVDAVLDLDEPYRSVILWRFFRGMSPRQIARHQDAPVETIHSQLRRGLAKLQGRLDRTHDGDRQAWLVALLPLVRGGGPEIGLLAGVLMMKTKILAVASVLAIVALGWWVWPDSAGYAGTEDPGTDELAANAGADPKSAAEKTDERREVVETEESPRPSSATLRIVRGLLLDSAARPLPDTAVEWRASAGGEDRTATSDSEGRFELRLPPSKKNEHVHVAGAGWTTVMAGLVAPNAGEGGVKPVVVAARAITVGGSVRDPRGNPLADAVVTCRLPERFAARFSVSLDAAARASSGWAARTDSEGRYELRAIGMIPEARIAARRVNYVPTSVPQPPVSDANVHLVMSPPEADAAVVRGQVIDVYGDPVADVDVCFGTGHARSDKQGQFTLPREKSLGRKVVQAMKRGYLPTRAEVPEPEKDDATPPFLYLVLGGVPLSIRGRVVDQNGQGVSRVRVWAEGGEMVPFLASGSLATTEGYLSGALTPREWKAKHPGKSFDGVIDREPLAYWGWVETDGQGRFELGGLQDKEYGLGLFRVAGLQLSKSQPIRAGSQGVEIVLRAEVHEVVSGQVVGPNGEPVPDVLVQLCCRASQVTLVDGNGKVRMSNGAVYHGPEVRTGKDGRFEFEDVGADQSLLTFNGDMIQSRVFGMDEGGIRNASERPVHDLRVPVRCRMHLRIDLPSKDEADRFQVLDGGGKPMPIVLFEGGGRNESRTRSIAEGRTRVYAVGQDAVTAVLFVGDGKGGQREVRRVPLQLRAGRVNVVR